MEHGTTPLSGVPFTPTHLPVILPIKAIEKALESSLIMVQEPSSQKITRPLLGWGDFV